MSDSNRSRPPLFNDFPSVSTEEWEQIISRDLKGANYKEKLRWQTGEGINPLPFYRKEDLNKVGRQRPLEKKGGAGWEIREPVFRQNVSEANGAALEALEGGADSLQFYLQVMYTEGMLGGDLAGTAVKSQPQFTKLLEGIDLVEVPVHFDAAMATPVPLALLWNHVQSGPSAPEQVTATFSYDPFRSILLNGRLPKDEADFQQDIYQMAQFRQEHLPGVRPLCIDARTYHNSGATIIEELGFALASASEYLAMLTARGMDATEAAESLHFQFSIGSNYFLEVAKFRTLRLLWQQVLEAYGADPQQAPAYVHGETSRRNKTLYDPYNNMLRTTTEGMSAAIAGCDSITILPFDRHFRSSDAFSERIARNSQIIMSEEAYLDKVHDPGAGSFYIEQLTDDMAREAWSFFQETEQVGGMTKAILDNFVQLTIEQSQQRRSKAVARGEQVLVGTNKYPNPEDRMAGKYQPDQPTVSLDAPEGPPDLDEERLIASMAEGLAGEADLKDFIPYLYDVGKQDIRQLPPFHEADPFEQLRLITEKQEIAPVVMTLPVGEPKVRKARSAFAANFFGCAGYQINEPLGFDAIEEALTTATKKIADILVLCSTDEAYEDLVPAAGEVLETMEDPPLLVVAGYPEEHLRSYRKKGVDAFIHRNSNVLETLQLFHKKLGLTE